MPIPANNGKGCGIWTRGLSDVFCAMIGDKLINPMFIYLVPIIRMHSLVDLLWCSLSPFPSSYIPGRLATTLGVWTFSWWSACGQYFCHGWWEVHWLLKDTDTKNGGCVGGKRQSDLDQVVCPKEMFFFLMVCSILWMIQRSLDGFNCLEKSFLDLHDHSEQTTMNWMHETDTFGPNAAC